MNRIQHFVRDMRPCLRLFSDRGGRVVPSVLPDFKRERSAKYFNHQQFEMEVYNWWEMQGYFQPSVAEAGKDPYVVIMPPPNVTGRLHMGHAVFASIQDLLCRYHRMLGKSTLWLPGSDHAGIATQYVVMQKLKNEGIDINSITREDFLFHAWKYKEDKGDEIFAQLRRLGASADWSRSKFTLDVDMQESVVEAFIKLHEKGLIYRGKYMVNWSPSLQTAVSDLEVDFVEEETQLFHFKYRVVDDQGEHTAAFIPVSTTRPETIPGDSAVCVHPDDSRYTEFVGKWVEVPISGRLIPVLADEYVDISFGTGALKVTPAHDPNDYEIGKRHDLDAITIMNPDGTMNSQAGCRYEGHDRIACRQMIWEDMQRDGLVLKVEAYIQRVPRSQRSGEIIEPMLSEQWFMKMDDMAKKAVEAVKNQDVKIVPDKFEKMWFNWLGNNHDWCISRQLWWGHRIPIYYVVGDMTKWVVARNKVEAHHMARVQYGMSVEVVQDNDVLDTWFSSALWPFITLGWPAAADGKGSEEGDNDFTRFYPTAVLETGYDIIFFWVARMAMLGLELTEKVPFSTVYLHGLVRDKNHDKMSKTKGNVVDPLDTINTYGCDALRFSLISGLSPGQDVAFDVDRVNNSRNLTNKIWNLGKYIALTQSYSQGFPNNLDNYFSSSLDVTGLPLPERYILSRCHQVVSKVTHSLENYQFAEGAVTIQDFIRSEFADWFVEINKTRTRKNPDEFRESQRVLHYVWDRCLHLLHPFMPFLTETLWLQSRRNCESLMISPWPKNNDDVDKVALDGFETFQALVKAIRAVRTDYKVESKATIRAYVNFSEKGLADKNLSFSDFKSEENAIAFLSRVRG